MYQWDDYIIFTNSHVHSLQNNLQTDGIKNQETFVCLTRRNDDIDGHSPTIQWHEVVTLITVLFVLVVKGKTK